MRLVVDGQVFTECADFEQWLHFVRVARAAPTALFLVVLARPTLAVVGLRAHMVVRSA